MRPAISSLAILVLSALFLTGTPVQAQKKKKDADKDLDTKTTEKMVKAGVLVGKVAAVYEDSRKIRLSVTIQVPKLNTGALTSMQQAQQAMMTARLQGNYQGMIQAQQQMQQAQRTLYTVDTKTQDIEVEARDDVIVRTAKPKADFDDKGKVKKLTRAELKALKGPNPKLPGYKAEFGDVSTDQYIQVTLVRKKGAAAPKVVRPKKGKDVDAGAVDILGDSKPQISMIVILREPAPAK